MRVDEPGSNNQIRGVDDPSRTIGDFANRDNAASGDGYVRAKRERTRTVYHSAVLNE
jgi:hypothetical protein